MRVVQLEHKACAGCNLRGWPGDNYLSEGVFNFNCKLLVELPVLHQLREAVRDGDSVTAWWKGFLLARQRDVRWLRRQPLLAER